MVILCTAGAEDAGARADVFLAEKIGGQTRNSIQKLMLRGAVKGKNRLITKNDRVAAGESYEIVIPELEPDTAQPQAIPLDIVYEDEDVLVVNKPQGMVVHPAAGHTDGTLVNALLYYCGSGLSGIGGVLRPGIVHRIDQDTSGLLTVAKNDKAHRALASQLADHSMQRVYQAVVWGTPSPEEGCISAPIGRHPRDRKRMAVVPREGKPAVTHYKVLERYQGYSLIECRLETGRTHQIRVHMAHIRHPVIGDPVYCNYKSYFQLAGQCLHAKELRFVHPGSGELMHFTAPLPASFRNVLSILREQSGGV